MSDDKSVSCILATLITSTQNLNKDDKYEGDGIANKLRRLTLRGKKDKKDKKDSKKALGTIIFEAPYITTY